MVASLGKTAGNLRDRLILKLAQRGIQLSQDLTVDVMSDGEAVVRGTVDSYYQRQLIVHSIRLVSGVQSVRDALEVAARVDDRVSPRSPQLISSRWRQFVAAAALFSGLFMLT